MQAQKSRRRRVVTLAAGAFVAREVRKCCGSDSTHPVLVSEKLSRLVPPRQGYGYDLIILVGLTRYLRNLQREDIRTELLGEQSIVVCDGSISNLYDRFLLLLEGLHRRRAPALRAAMNGGYPLHIDATGEHGEGGLFLCLNGWRGWVLHAVKIASENAEELPPCIDETIRRFVDPIAVVRDLGTAKAVILKYLDRYAARLFGHPARHGDEGKIISVVERTNRDTRLLKRIGALIADEHPAQNNGIIDRHIRQPYASVAEI